MEDYYAIKINELYLDEFKQLLQFIADNYDWTKRQHLIYISKIGNVGISDTYQGKKGNKHQVFGDIELQVLKSISEIKRKELERILSPASLNGVAATTS